MRSWWRHAAIVVGGFTLLFAWLFAQPLTSGRLLAESDLFDQYLPLFRSPPLIWSSFEFAGVPAFADPENSAFYPVRWFFAAVAHSWNGFIISAFVIAACSTYAYLYFHTRSRPAATLGAIGFVLSEAMLERIPHANILHAIVWLPLLLLAVDAMRVSRRWWLWAAVAAFAGASCVLAGHPQMALYVAYLSAAYAAFGLLFERAPVNQWLRVATAAIVAGLLSAASAVPLVELSRHSLRQTVEFTDFVDYANTPAQMLSVLLPAVPHHGLEAPTYVGLVTLPLAIIGLTQLRANWRIAFWLMTAIASLALGAGGSTPLARVVYGLPLYDSFRIVARHLIFASFALNVLSALGFAAILSGRASRQALIGSGSMLVVLVLVGLVATGFDAAPWRQFLLAGVSVGALVLVWRYSHSRQLATAVIALLAADLLLSSSYDWTPRGLSMVTVDASAVTPSAQAEKLRAGLDASKQRFAAVPDSLRNDVVPGLFSRPWAIPNGGGYTSLLLKDVSALGMVAPNGRVDAAALSADDLGLDLLAVKYLIVRSDLFSGTLAESRWTEIDAFTVGGHPFRVFENRHALPRAWLATDVRPTTDGAMSDAVRTARLQNGEPFDPRRIALVFEGDVAAAQYHGNGAVDVTSIADSRIAVKVSSPSGGLLVLSEAYYPGWRVRIDDQPPQPVHKIDLALQGVTMPAGEHIVTFEFASVARQVGLALSGAGAIGLVGMVLLGIRQLR